MTRRERFLRTMTFVMMDSDGNVEELVPLWLDLGINVLHPMEIAAGMDVRAVQARFHLLEEKQCRRPSC